MLIKSLELKNFLGTRKIADKNGVVHIDFPTEEKQIILIKGENGYGKSTILENLTPYSSMLKRDLKSCISYPSYKKIVILKDGKEYRLETHYEDEKNKTGRIYIDDEPMSETKKGNITEFDYQVNRIFGDFEKFKNSVFLKQGTTEIIDAKPTERLNIINKFMPSLEVYDNAKKHSIEKEKEFKDKNQELKKRLKNIEEFAFKYERNKEEEKNYTEEIVNDWKNKKDNLEKLKDSYIKVEEEKKHLIESISLKELENKNIVIKEGLEEELKIANEKIVEIDEEKYWKNVETIKNIKEILFAIVDKEGNINYFEETLIKEIEKDIQKLENIQKEWIKENELINNKEKELESIIDDIKKIDIKKGLDIELKNINENIGKIDIKNIDVEEYEIFIDDMKSLSQTIKSLDNREYTKDFEKANLELELLNSKLIDLKEKEKKNIETKTKKIELTNNLKKENEKLENFKDIKTDIRKVIEEIQKVEIKNINIEETEEFIEEMKIVSQTIKSSETRKFNKNEKELEEEISLKNDELKLLKENIEKNNLNISLLDNLNKNLKEEKNKIIIIDNPNLNLKNLEKDLEDLNKKIYKLEDLKSNIEGLKDEFECPTCQKEISREDILKLEKKLEDLKGLNDKKSIIEKDIKESQDNLAKIETNKIIEKNIEELEEKIKNLSFLIKDIEIKNIIKIEVNIKDLELELKELSKIDSSINNVKKYNKFLDNFDFSDLDKLYEEYKEIFYNIKEVLKLEKDNKTLLIELNNKKSLLEKDLNNLESLQNNINYLKNELERCIIIEIDLNEITKIEKEIEELKKYIKEYKEISSSINNIKKYPNFLTNFEFSDLDKLYEGYKEIFIDVKNTLKVEKENKILLLELNSKKLLLEKDIKTNEENIENKKMLEKKEKDINTILKKERISFNEKDLIDIKIDLINKEKENKFYLDLKKNLVKIELEIKSNFNELNEDLNKKSLRINSEIDSVKKIREENKEFIDNVKSLEKEIQLNLINKNTLIKNEKDILVSNEKLSNIKEVDFSFNNFEEFNEKFNEFNEKFKEFLIDKGDLERKYQEYQELEEEISKYEKEEFMWNKLKNYSLKIKKAIISETFSEITETANEILKNEGTIGSLRLEINQINDRKFEIKVIDIARKDYEVSDISLLSGAEAMAVSKAISFSLSQKTNHRVLWLDESDGVLSPKNKNVFTQMLKKLFDNLNLEEIFVISHQKEVEDAVDHIIDINNLVQVN